MSDSEKLDLILSEVQNVKSEVQDIKSELHEVKSELQNVKLRVQSVESEVQNVKSEVQNVKSEVQNVKSEVQNLKSEVQTVKQKVANIELTLENETNHNIQLLAENHSTLIDKLNQAIKVTDKTLIWEVQLSGFRIRLEKIEQEINELKSKIA